MPRNSTGSYTLPAGNPVLPDTLIETGWANPTMSDIGAALTDSLDRQGRGTMLAPLKIIDGTVVSPAISFNSDSATGIYRAAPSTLGFAAGGILALSLGASGATLAAGLHVGGNTFLGGPLAASSGTAALPGLAFSAETSSGLFRESAGVVGMSVLGVKRQQWDASGTNITGTLNVNGLPLTPGAYVLKAGDLMTGALTVTGFVASVVITGNTPAFHLGESGVSSWDIRTPAGSGAISFFDLAAGAERLRISPAGSVGIGTNSPTSKLTVSGPAAILARVESSTNADFRGFTYGIVGDPNAYASHLFNPDSGELRHTAGVAGFGGFQSFHANGSERMRINSGGLVGIGITTPTVQLHVQATVAEALRLQATSGAYASFVDSAGAPRGYIGNGTLASGTTAQFALRAESDLLFASGGGTERMRLPAAGGLEVVAGIAVTNGPVRLALTGGDGATVSIVGNTSAHALALWTSGLERARFSSGGLFGLGTNNPTSKLHVVGPSTGADAFTLDSATTNTYMVFLANGSPLGYVGSGNLLSVQPNSLAIRSDTLLVFGFGGVEKMRIDSGGPSTATPAVGANTNYLATTAFVQANSVGTIARTWQNVAASRAFNTDYTSPAYPIQVNVAPTFPSNGGGATMIVGGITVGSFANGVNAGISVALSAVVPPNTTYRVNSGGTGAAMGTWAELR